MYRRIRAGAFHAASRTFSPPASQALSRRLARGLPAFLVALACLAPVARAQYLPRLGGPSHEPSEAAARGPVVAVESSSTQAAAAATCDVWLVDARHCRCDCEKAPDLGFWRYEGGRWNRATVQEFVATTPVDHPTCIWVHGNRIDSSEANSVGWTVYRRLSAANPAQPMRFVIWSWPSSQIRGQLRDVRVKATRADSQSLPLAWLLRQVPEERPVSLVGYSYGARLIAGSLHWLGRWSQPPGAAIPIVAGAPPRRRAVLLAAAMDDYALAQGAHRGRALSQVESMLVTVNYSDPALRWYPRLWGRGGPDALGYTGVVGNLGTEKFKVREFDASCYVGQVHDWQAFASSRRVMSEVARVALFPPPQ